MKNDALAIATISLVRNSEEEQTLKASLAALSQLNVPVFVTDGGSPESFLQVVKSLPNFTLMQPPAKGLFAQAKNSLQAAADTGRQFVFYTEPDKKDFFEKSLSSMVTSIEANESLGATLASRTAAGFASFPAFQQMTETTINNCCGELIGQLADYCYGPFLLNAKLVSSLTVLPEDIGWGWRPFVFHTAFKQGYKISFVAGDFYCPEDQRKDDANERVYRMKQLEQNIRGLVLAVQ